MSIYKSYKTRIKNIRYNHFLKNCNQFLILIRKMNNKQEMTNISRSASLCANQSSAITIKAILYFLIEYSMSFVHMFSIQHMEVH